MTSTEVTNWIEESTYVINDMKCYVAIIEISKELAGSDGNIYLNIRTIEGNDFCVHFSRMGFHIVGKAFDNIDLQRNLLSEVDCYDTQYELLDVLSPEYMQSFDYRHYQQLGTNQRCNFNEDNIEDMDTASSQSGNILSYLDILEFVTNRFPITKLKV